VSDIAIVGIGCRYAGGIESPETFWRFVVEKRDGVVEIPANRWDWRRYYDPDKRTPGRSYTKRGAFLTVDPWEFDPDFFGISVREATVLDPQQVVLKKLDDAVRAGDRIYAVVKATGANQDGRTTAITVPNASSQEALARAVCARAGLSPAAITYVEAHGTGTLVGDPPELRALGRVYGASTGRTRTLGVGSLKATLGHTEAAAGVASVIKAALAIHHRTIPPQGWLDKPSPDIPFDELGLHVQLESEPLAPRADPMTMAVNGFGYGGTNAHAILQECRSAPAPRTQPARHFGILPISARSADATRALAGRFADLIAAGADADNLAEAAWTRMAHFLRVQQAERSRSGRRSATGLPVTARIAGVLP
jgi:acyl transferase domain-containing protein